MKKKGFTLIELLAVIVLLAVIAIIAVPIVLNLISGARKNASIESQRLYLNAVEQAIARNNLYGEYNPSYCEIVDGELLCDDEKLIVDHDGKMPDYLSLNLDNGKIATYFSVLDDVEYTNIDKSCFVSAARGELTWYNCDNTVVAIPSSLPLAEITGMHFSKTRCLGIYNSESVCDEMEAEYDSYLDETHKNDEDYAEKKAMYLFMSILDYEIIDEKEEDITTIGLWAFAYKNLDSIYFGNKITSIGGLSFAGNNFEKVIIPDSVTNIGTQAFEKNHKLETVVIGNGVTEIRSAAFDDCSIENLTIGSSVNKIGYMAFKNNKIKNLVIPDNVVQIDTSAFLYNNLVSLTIGSGIESIEWNAFDGGTDTDTNHLAIGPNALTSVKINKPSSMASSFTSKNQFGWAEGYDNSYICWSDSVNCGN